MRKNLEFYSGAIHQRANRTVVCIDKREIPPYGVRFDAPFEDGHKLDGHCEDGYGWWCREDNLQLVTERQHNVEDLYKIWEGNI